jgi:hypothetical protein
MIPVEDYNQLKFRFTDPIQDNYEAIRPVVVFAETISERSRQTGIDRTVVGKKARRFIEQGMLGLQDQRLGHSGRKSKEYPDAVAEYIFYLKQIYPPIHYREIVRIIERKKEVLDLQQEYPRAGRFRVHGLLEKQYQEQERDEKPPSECTVGRAMAINRQFHGAPGPWQSNKKAVDPDATPKYLPYRPQYRQQMWFFDVRYLVKLEGRWVYSICVIEGYSRAILAGMASEHQDLTAILQILYAALSEYGCPELIVSDNAKVFHANDYLDILDGLRQMKCAYLGS